MWVAGVSALICFAVATVFFTPPLRSFPFYQSISFYFLFEGAWTVLNAVVMAIWPYSTLMMWVHYIGAIFFGGYLFYCLYVYYCKEKRAEKKQTEVQIVDNITNIQTVNKNIAKAPEKAPGEEPQKEQEKEPEKAPEEVQETGKTGE